MIFNDDVKIESQYIGLLDLGSNFVRCAVLGSNSSDDNVSLLSSSSVRSQGILRGYITNLEKAEICIRDALSKCEKVANVPIEDVIISIGSNIIKSTHMNFEIELGGYNITKVDLKNIYQIAWGHINEDKTQEYLHAIPINYSVDGNDFIENPIGMYGSKLGVVLNMISVDSNVLKNIKTVFDNARFNVVSVIASPYATAYGCLQKGEYFKSTLVIDFGFSYTSSSLYENGNLVFVNSTPMGGDSVTKDIAQGLNMSYEEAEKLKILDGKTVVEPKDDYVSISFYDDIDNTKREISKSLLIGIVKPRFEEILENLKRSLNVAGYDSYDNIIITGGGSRISMLDRLVSNYFSTNVYRRIVSSLDDKGDDNISLSPNENGEVFFTTLKGLVNLILNKEKLYSKLPIGDKSWFKRTCLWLRENL